MKFMTIIFALLLTLLGIIAEGADVARNCNDPKDPCAGYLWTD